MIQKLILIFCQYFVSNNSWSNWYRYVRLQISEESDEAPGIKASLTTSQFVEWSCAQFAQPVSVDTEAESTNDVESRAHYEREWRYVYVFRIFISFNHRTFSLIGCYFYVVRYLRNKRQRREVREEQKKMSSIRIESQIFHARCPQQPEVLLFHPFDSHLAVACRDHFG